MYMYMYMHFACSAQIDEFRLFSKDEDVSLCRLKSRLYSSWKPSTVAMTILTSSSLYADSVRLATPPHTITRLATPTRPLTHRGTIDES